MLNVFHITAARDNLILPAVCIFVVLMIFHIFQVSKMLYISYTMRYNLLWKKAVTLLMCTDPHLLAKEAFFLFILQFAYRHETCRITPQGNPLCVMLTSNNSKFRGISLRIIKES